MMSYQPVSTIDPTKSQGLSNSDFNGSGRNSSNITWEYLRKEARSIEQQIDSRLITYSQAYSQSFSSNLNHNHSSNTSSAILVTQQELHSLLMQLERITNEMKPFATNNSSYNHLYSRHVANLYEYNKEFNKTRSNLQHHMDRSELFVDTSDGNGTGNGIYSRAGASHANQLGRMENAHDAVDEILQRALDSQADLERQQNDLRSFQNRLKRVLVRFPLVRNILSQIQQKKNRDTVILGTLIGVCSCILLWIIIF